MPVSDNEGKEWSKDRIIAARPAQVWDFGAGSGTYSDLLRSWLPEAKFVAIEIFEPYIGEYNLRDKYDEVVLADARTVNTTPAPNSVAIFGDILEHMHESEARALIAEVKDVFEYILVSLPIVHSPQGEVNGNIYETHHKDWGFSEMHELMDFCESYEGHTLGIYWWEKAYDKPVGYYDDDNEWDPDEPCWCGCDDNYEDRDDEWM